MSARPPARLSQEAIVAAIAAVLFLGFAATLPVFRSADNLLSLLQNVSILGILGTGMAVSIIGRGIDLSIVTVMAMSSAWVLQLANGGLPFGAALAAGLGLAVAVGLLNGLLIAFLEVPAIFATLAVATLNYGFVRALLLEDNQVYLKAAVPDWFAALGGGTVLGIPVPVLMFALVSLIVHLVLRHHIAGRFLYAMGENPAAARITGVPGRPMVLLQYALCSVIGFAAGIILASAIGSVETRVARSTMVYDVILVAVIGGIGLAGGKGGVRNVLVGTALIGVLLNGMTILNTSYTVQNILKSIILMLAIVADSLLNPRDEQTGQQGDI